MTLKAEMLAELDDVFFAVAEFGAVATTSGAGPIKGIFFSDYFLAEPGGGVGIRSTSPVFRAATASATGVTEGSKLTIDAAVYTVVEPKPDDSGVTDFRLFAD